MSSTPRASASQINDASAKSIGRSAYLSIRSASTSVVAAGMSATVSPPLPTQRRKAGIKCSGRRWQTSVNTGQVLINSPS